MSPKSPCTKVCMIDPETELCAGCYRTLGEIARWSSYSEDEKGEVWKKIEIRKSELQNENGLDGSA